MASRQKTITYRENDIRQQIITYYKQYLISQKRKNITDINQAYGRMEVWRSIYDEMGGDCDALDKELDAIQKKLKL